VPRPISRAMAAVPVSMAEIAPWDALLRAIAPAPFAPSRWVHMANNLSATQAFHALGLTVTHQINLMSHVGHVNGWSHG
jgi:hypothetical protein